MENENKEVEETQVEQPTNETKEMEKANFMEKM